MRIAQPPAEVSVDMAVMTTKGALGNSVHILFLVQNVRT